MSTDANGPETVSPGTVSVFEIDKAAKPLQWPDKLGGDELVCRAVGANEAAMLQQVMDRAGDYPPGDVAERFTRERQAYIGQITEAGQERPTVVAYGWVALTIEPLGNSGYAFQPLPGDAYLYDFATLPDHRGRGYYPALLRFILGELARQGIRRVWIGTAPGNGISARSIARAGFQLIVEVRIHPPGAGEPFRFEPVPVPGVDAELLEIARNANISYKPEKP